jgi:polyphosphate kinase 2 (PPK2 family)
MIQRTSTPTAPWNVIPANDKYYARVKIVQTVVESIRTGLKRPYAHAEH